jgi:hypothetical protein
MEIPGQFGQAFRFGSDTYSDLLRTLVPIQFGQLSQL